jgi:hypothetical protein
MVDFGAGVVASPTRQPLQQMRDEVPVLTIEGHRAIK